eukprot:256096-Chlamydomonas_euryale.AAC.2
MHAGNTGSKVPKQRELPGWCRLLDAEPRVAWAQGHAHGVGRHTRKVASEAHAAEQRRMPDKNGRGVRCCLGLQTAHHTLTLSTLPTLRTRGHALRAPHAAHKTLTSPSRHPCSPHCTPHPHTLHTSHTAHQRPSCAAGSEMTKDVNTPSTGRQSVSARMMFRSCDRTCGNRRGERG